MPENILKNKAIHGIGWSAIDNVARLGVSFIVNIILARLLTPDDYGLIGIIAILISLSNAIIDGGFANALIRKHNANEVDFYTAFWTNLILSILLCILLYSLSDYIALFFNRSELTNLVKVMSMILIINALSLVPKAKLTKQINFKSQTQITIITSVLSGLVGIFMAINGYGVWALVGQQITASILNTALLWLFNNWYPRLVFSSESFHGLWSFGWKISLVTVIDTLWKQMYQIVIAKFYTPRVLGQYTRAEQFANLFSTNLTTVIQRVSYPVLSTIKEDKIRLKSAYKRIIKMTMLPTFVLMIGMASVAKSMILVLIGDKWLPCVPMLQILCFTMMLYPLHAINLNMLQVQGRSDLFLRIEVVKKIIMVIPIVGGIFINIYWMLFGSFITGIISYYLNAFYSGRFLNYGILSQIKDILPSLFVAVFMAVPVYLMSYIPISPYILLPLQIIFGGTITCILCHKLNLDEYKEFVSIVISFKNKMKSKISYN